VFSAWQFVSFRVISPRRRAALRYNLNAGAANCKKA